MTVTRSAKKIVQVALGTEATAVYTSPVNTVTQITEIWLANTNTTTTRKVSLYAHGTASENTIIPELQILAKGTKIITDARIILAAAEVLAAKQDIGTDVILTAYGVLEVTS